MMKWKGGFPVWGKMVITATPFAILGYLLLSSIVPVEMSRLTEQRRLASLGSLGIARTLLVDLEQFETAWEKEEIRMEDITGLLDEEAIMGDGSLYDTSSSVNFGVDQTAECRLYFYKNDAIYQTSGGRLLDAVVTYEIPAISFDAILNCARTEQLVSVVHHDSTNHWMATYTPVVGMNKTVIGVMELRSDAENTISSGQKDTKEVSRIILYVSLGLMSAVFFTVWFNMRPLKELKVAVLAAAEGNLEIEAKTRGNSEAAGIAAVFNRMIKGISGHISQTQAFQKRYAAFVPNEAFLLLGSKDAGHVHLGDEREIEAFIMAVQSEENPYERLLDTNRCLEIQVSEIQKHGGIIRDFQGIGEESFFPGNVEEVLYCAVSVLQRTGQDEPSTRLHIGIAYGEVKIGIIGGTGRSSVAVVSEYGRLSWFLQGMAQTYAASLLITDKAAKKSCHFEDSYHYRILGYVYITLHGTMERVYEVLDGDTEAVLSRKYRSRELFEEGVSCFMSGRFLEARRQFISVLTISKEDVAAQRYVHLCDQYYHGLGRSDIPVCLEVY